MKRKLLYLLILIFIFGSYSACFAKISFTKKEKAQLKGYHSVFKKKYFLTKKSSFKGLQAKIKQKNKKIKKQRMKRGI